MGREEHVLFGVEDLEESGGLREFVSNFGLKWCCRHGRRETKCRGGKPWLVHLIREGTSEWVYEAYVETDRVVGT